MDLQGILGWLSYYTMEILNYGDLLTYLLTEPITEMLSHLKTLLETFFPIPPLKGFFGAPQRAL